MLKAEPRDLPGPLPEGERVIWQGRPCRRGLARDVFHVRLLAIYFAAALVVLGAGSLLVAGRPAGPTALSLLPLMAGAVAVVAFAMGLAWLGARTTRYTMTNRRVVMRIGMALPIHLNLPFASVEGAGLRLNADGTGDLPIRLGGKGRIGYLHLWPHARPWHLRRPEPMLRAVPDAVRVATILAQALAEAGAPAAMAGARPARPATAARPDRAVAETGMGNLPPMAA